MFKLPAGLIKRIGLILLALFFMAAGINHFVNPNIYVAIMPTYLPAHREMVYLSGFFEVFGGICVLVSPMRQWAGYGLIALLFAVFPANIYMAMNPDKFENVVSAWALYARLPLQFLLIWWAFLVTRHDMSTD